MRDDKAKAVFVIWYCNYATQQYAIVLHHKVIVCALN